MLNVESPASSVWWVRCLPVDHDAAFFQQAAEQARGEIGAGSSIARASLAPLSSSGISPHKVSAVDPGSRLKKILRAVPAGVVMIRLSMW